MIACLEILGTMKMNNLTIKFSTILPVSTSKVDCFPITMIIG